MPATIRRRRTWNRDCGFPTRACGRGHLTLAASTKKRRLPAAQIRRGPAGCRRGTGAAASCSPGAPSSSAARCRACSPPRSCGGPAGCRPGVRIKTGSTSAHQWNLSAGAPALRATLSCWKHWKRAESGRATTALRLRDASRSTATVALSASANCARFLGSAAEPAARHHPSPALSLGCAFQHFDQDGSQVRVGFADGRMQRADLLVGGDGIRSAARAAVAPEVQPPMRVITFGAAQPTSRIWRRPRSPAMVLHVLPA